MKHLVSIIAVLVAMLVIGCEDSGLLEPNHVSSGPILLQKTEPAGVSDLATPNWEGTSQISQNIEICSNPGEAKGNSTGILNGTIDYSITPSQIRPEDYITFWAALRAHLVPSNGTDQVIEIFEEKSEEHIFLSTDGVPTVIVRSYEGAGSMTLYVEYKISRRDFAINNMWIVDSPIKTN